MHLWGARLPDLGSRTWSSSTWTRATRRRSRTCCGRRVILHERLDGLGLKSYPKTSGGDGLHVFLPLAPGHTFEAVRDWVRDLAEALEAAHPKLIAVSHGPTHRGST